MAEFHSRKNSEETIANRIEITKDDITRQSTDAIVNAANESLLGGGGVDGAIHRAAGFKLLAECQTIGGCPTGQARITNGYNLKARYVIHTVGPVWKGGDQNEENLLASCYQNSLKLAADHNIKTIAFPSISTGVYGFPKEKACHIALKEVTKFLKENTLILKVKFICFSEPDLETYRKAIQSIY